MVVPGNLDDGRKKKLAMHVVADLCEFFVWKAGWMMGASWGKRDIATLDSSERKAGDCRQSVLLGSRGSHGEFNGCVQRSCPSAC